VADPPGQRAQRHAAAVALDDACPLVLGDRVGRLREDRHVRVVVIVLADGVQHGERRAVDPPGDAPGDLIGTAAAVDRQPAGLLKDVLALGVGQLGEVGPARHLLAVAGEKALDAGDQEAHPPFAVREDELARRQAAAAPALDRLAGDVEPLAHRVNVEHWLGYLGGVDFEGVAHRLDEQAEVVVEGQARQQVARDGVDGGLGAVPGNAVNDEIEGVRLGGVEAVDQFLGRGDLS